MLFDLKGRRRRVVQVTYVGLAVLMGGGLVLSGIGSDASGGLLDAFIGSDTAGDGDARKPFENQIEGADGRLRANPEDQAALATLVRAHFGLAGLEQQEQDGSGRVHRKRHEELQQADAAWDALHGDEPRADRPGARGDRCSRSTTRSARPADGQAREVRPARARDRRAGRTRRGLHQACRGGDGGRRHADGRSGRAQGAFLRAVEGRKATHQGAIETAKTASASRCGWNGAAPTPAARNAPSRETRNNSPQQPRSR